jgi:Fic family protein
MTDFVPLKWSYITDLPEDWKETLSNPQTVAMAQTWHEQQEELRSKGAYKYFLEKLKRQWSIETGVIEGAYSLSDGATRTLIEKGIDATFIAHTDTRDEPQNVVTKILDHHQAIEGLYEFVSGDRELSLSYIKELHCVLMANQRTYQARDKLGNWVTRELPLGKWKTLENDVEHVDGGKFEFCPPIHVQQEMENLLSFHNKHINEGVPPDVQAAWLHHRFTIIHPFTDGNGRVARCLATLVLLKAFWLPLVVTRTDRDVYITALRAADIGDLRPLVDFIGLLQRKAIREAISLGEQASEEAQAFEGILTAVAQKFSQRRQADQALRTQAKKIADSLFQSTNKAIEIKADAIANAIRAESSSFNAYLTSGENESDKRKYYYKQVVEAARQYQYFANMNVYHAWSSLVIITNRRAEILISIHGIGGSESGIFGCTAIFFTKDPQDDLTQISDYEPLGNEPFEFSYTEDGSDVQRRYSRWLDNAVLKGLQKWQATV